MQNEHRCNDLEFAIGYNEIPNITISNDTKDVYILYISGDDGSFIVEKQNDFYIQGLNYCPFCGKRLVEEKMVDRF